MSTRLQLYLRAEKLKNVAGLFHGTSDPYCVVTVTGGAHDGTEIGRTSTVKNTLNPEWTDVFTIDFHRPGLFTEISVEVFDEIKKKDDKFMGSAKFVISDVIDTKGNEKGEEVENGGMIFLHVVESIRGDSSGWFNFQIRALDIKNIESGLLGIGATDPFFEISRKYADHSTGVSRWYTVYRSKPIMDNHNPVWDEDSIGMEELCHCDPKWPLKLTVLDWEKSGKHRKIGEVVTCAATLMQQVAVKGNADREKAFAIFKVKEGQVQSSNRKGVGQLLVLSAAVRS